MWSNKYSRVNGYSYFQSIQKLHLEMAVHSGHETYDNHHFDVISLSVPDLIDFYTYLMKSTH